MDSGKGGTVIMAKQYETVIGLEVHIDKDFLWMQYRIWWGTEYAYLPGLHRYAWVASGIE